MGICGAIAQAMPWATITAASSTAITPESSIRRFVVAGPRSRGRLARVGGALADDHFDPVRVDDAGDALAPRLITPAQR